LSEAFPDKLTDLPLIFLDLETTGLTIHEGHRVCEVALIREQGGVEQQRLSLLIDPERELDPQASAVNGLSREMLAGAPRFAEVADEVLTALAGGVIVAHNAPFDVMFLNYELSLLGRPALNLPALDTLSLARRLMRRSSYSLAALAEHLQLEPPTHRALADVLALRGLFYHLMELMAEKEITTLYDVLRFERGIHPGEPELELPLVVARAMAEGRRLRIVYTSRSTPEPTTRLITPLSLSKQGEWTYLRAYCFLRHDLRAFALDKIERMELE
jgi:DNA polymerase III subunit epsilon